MFKTRVKLTATRITKKENLRRRESVKDLLFFSSTMLIVVYVGTRYVLKRTETETTRETADVSGHKKEKFRAW